MLLHIFIYKYLDMDEHSESDCTELMNSEDNLKPRAHVSMSVGTDEEQNQYWYVCTGHGEVIFFHVQCIRLHA